MKAAPYKARRFVIMTTGDARQRYDDMDYPHRLAAEFAQANKKWNVATEVIEVEIREIRAVARRASKGNRRNVK